MAPRGFAQVIPIEYRDGFTIENGCELMAVALRPHTAYVRSPNTLKGKAMTKANNTIQSEGVSRRGFLGGLAAFSGAVAMGAAGCSPKPNGGGSDGGSTPATKASEADPIAPAAVPAAWDEESDVVVVGTGGGLVAAVYAAMNGKKVTVLEKAATWGGSSKETDIFSVLGTKTQQAIYQALGA